VASAYQRGRAFEYRVRDRLRECGYFVVRSASSKGPCDLIAVRADGAPLLVQCKHGAHPALPPAEWNFLLDAATSVHAIPLLAISRRRRLTFMRLIARKDGTRPRGTTLGEPLAITAPKTRNAPCGASYEVRRYSDRNDRGDLDRRDRNRSAKNPSPRTGGTLPCSN
jgi:hypothetical protein